MHGGTGLPGSASPDCKCSCETLPLRNFKHKESASVTVLKGLASGCLSFCVILTCSDFISHGTVSQKERFPWLLGRLLTYMTPWKRQGGAQNCDTKVPLLHTTMYLSCLPCYLPQQKPKDQTNDYISCWAKSTGTVDIRMHQATLEKRQKKKKGSVPFQDQTAALQHRRHTQASIIRISRDGAHTVNLVHLHVNLETCGHYGYI